MKRVWHFTINSWFSNYFASGLSSGLIAKQKWIKLLNYYDHLWGYFNDWIGFYFIVHIAIKGFKWEYGTIPSANYMAVTPSDQISVFWL